MRSAFIFLMCLGLTATACAQEKSSGKGKVIIALKNPIVQAGTEVYVGARFNDAQDDPLALTGLTNPKYRFEAHDERGHLVKKIASPGTPLGMPFVEILGSKETLTPATYQIQAFRRTGDSVHQEDKSNIVTVTIRKANLTRPPFTIAVTPENSEVRSGSPVYLKVALTNHAPYDLGMSTAFGNGIPHNWNYRFEVRDGAGKPIEPKPLNIVTGEPQNIFVEPEKTSTSDELVSALYDMLTPGKYTIQAFCYASVDPKDGQIGSNVVTVTIVP